MVEFVSVLNTVVRLSTIKKIAIKYNNGTNYSNQWLHTLWIEYMDGKEDKYSTTDRDAANKDYEGLKNALLNYGREGDFG